MSNRRLVLVDAEKLAALRHGVDILNGTAPAPEPFWDERGYYLPDRVAKVHRQIAFDAIALFDDEEDL